MATAILARLGRSVEPTLVACVAIAGMLSLAACAPSTFGPTAPAFVPRTFPEFARQPDRQPTISSGRAGRPVVAFDPAIYVDDEGYHLFYTTLFCRAAYGYSYSWYPANPGRRNIMNAVGSIAYAFSNDQGLTWRYRETPVVLPSDSGFDSAKIETAFVFRQIGRAHV